MNRSTDNRDMKEMEAYYIARIEMLEWRIKNLKGTVNDLENIIGEMERAYANKQD